MGEEGRDAPRKERTIKARFLRKKQTPWESLLWQNLRSRKLQGFRFKRQVVIGCYIVDFLCWEKRLIVEVDGYQHSKSGNKQYDKSRTDFLESLGYKVIRFWNSAIDKDINAVLDRIIYYLHQPR